MQHFVIFLSILSLSFALGPPAHAGLIDKICLIATGLIGGEPRAYILTAPVYSASDFPKSEFWYGTQITKYGVSFRPHSDKYSQWAATEANRAMTKTREKGSLSQILAECAQSRQSLEEELQSPYGHQAYEPVGTYQNASDPQNFGTPREYMLEFTFRKPEDLGPRGRELSAKANSDLKPVTPQQLERLNKILYGLYPSKFKTYDFNSLECRETFYITSDGKKINATTMTRFKRGPEAEKMVVLHPSKEELLLIMKDVTKRLEVLRKRLRKTPEPGEKDYEEFIVAMYGYYQAQMYKRGASAIGKSYFSGIYSGMFDEPMPPLPDGLDVMAFTATSQESFVKEVLPLFTKGRTVPSSFSDQNTKSK